MDLEVTTYKSLLGELIKNAKNSIPDSDKVYNLTGSEELSVLMRHLSEKGFISLIENSSIEAMNNYLDLINEEGKRGTSEDMGGNYFARYSILDLEALKDYQYELEFQPSINPLINENVKEYQSSLEKQIDDFAIHSNGLIKYKEQVLRLEPRYRDILALFLNRTNDRVLYDDFRDIFEGSTVEQATLSKYVSELRSILSPYPLEIRNDRGQGYIFIYPIK